MAQVLGEAVTCKKQQSSPLFLGVVAVFVLFRKNH
jgi:hypothetical protein